MKSCENSSFFEWFKTHKWSQLPYPGQTKPYKGIDNKAGQWPFIYLKRDCQNNIIDPLCDNKAFYISNPCDYNFEEELQYLKEVSANLTEMEIGMAKYFAIGVPADDLSRIALTLINTYSVTPAMAARIMSVVSGAMNDAFVVAWYLKYLFNIARPVQLDTSFKTVVPTPKFPSYPSGHSVSSGTVTTVLSYFFPSESDKLSQLAHDASLSRVYGGIHFKCDSHEGVNLGVLIGNSIVEYLKQENICSQYPIDVPYVDFLDAPIIPNYIDYA